MTDHFRKKVCIIGAGLGGLSCAIHLAVRGFKVDVYEQQDFPGGKAGSLSAKGFRFDTGPSLLTLPFVFDDLFKAAGKTREQYLKFIPLDPVCRYFYPDKTILNGYSRLEDMAAEFRNVLEEPEQNTINFMKSSERIYRLTAPLFLFSALRSWKTLLNPQSWKTLFSLPALHPFRSMHRHNVLSFQSPLLHQLFDRYATYNGSDPFRSPATLSIIPYTEYGFGGYGVENGIQSIPKSMEQLARSLGISFFYSRKVEHIITDRKKVKSLQIGDEMIPCHSVVSNCDVSVTYEKLLNNTRIRWYRLYERREPSSSGLVFMWGVKGIHPQLGVHNILFSRDYKQDFRNIFHDKICPRDPTVYINITSKINDTDAPQGYENWFVLINGPADFNQDWDTETGLMREAVFRRIQEQFGLDLSAKIVFEKVLTPPDIQRQTFSRRGSLYGISSNTASSAFLRHPQRSPHYQGLYFCGGSAHPGGGMPLVVLSGKIAAEQLASDLQSR